MQKITSKLTRFKGFSLVELMISLITISCIVAAFTPVITKKLKKQDIAISIAQSSEIISPCKKEGDKFVQSTNENEDCQLCTSTKCIKCQKECGNGYYLDSNACECISCDKFKGEGENGVCQTCTKNGCTLCKTTTNTWNKGYIIGTSGDNKGKCVKCNDANLPSNGTNQCAVPCVNGAGYYCNANNEKVYCSKEYNSACTSCNSSGCTGCLSHYAVTTKSEGWCKYCGAECVSCTFKADGTRVCTQCNGDWVHNTAKNTCPRTCNTSISNCHLCKPLAADNATECTKCQAGYKLRKISEGHVDCIKCSEGNVGDGCVACDGDTCILCDGGYYLQSGKCNKCPNIAHCNQCKDATTCDSCVPGYYLSKDKKSCIANDSNFRCSDSNFIQIGNLCVTRKNMGDSSVLEIPPSASVTIAEVNVEYCYPSSSQGCCWKGQTGMSNCSVGAGGSGNCNDYGSYSGSTRTVCTRKAAEDICDSFNYAGKKWRLPTNSEMATWLMNSLNHGDDGLQLCHWHGPELKLKFCRSATKTCLGLTGGVDQCWPSYVIGKDGNHMTVTDGNKAIHGFSTGYSYNSNASSVRCVTEME